jgi:hypothetical protein
VVCSDIAPYPFSQPSARNGRGWVSENELVQTTHREPLRCVHGNSPGKIASWAGVSGGGAQLRGPGPLS